MKQFDQYHEADLAQLMMGRQGHKANAPRIAILNLMADGRERTYGDIKLAVGDRPGLRSTLSQLHETGIISKEMVSNVAVWRKAEDLPTPQIDFVRSVTE